MGTLELFMLFYVMSMLQVKPCEVLSYLGLYLFRSTGPRLSTTRSKL